MTDVRTILNAAAWHALRSERDVVVRVLINAAVVALAYSPQHRGRIERA